MSSLVETSVTSSASESCRKKIFKQEEGWALNRVAIKYKIGRKREGKNFINSKLLLNSLFQIHFH